jgi:hypothetical protein
VRKLCFHCFLVLEGLIISHEYGLVCCSGEALGCSGDQRWGRSDSFCRFGWQNRRGGKMDSKTNILNKKYFLLSISFKLLNQTKITSINVTFVKLITSVSGGRCDYSPRATKKPSYVTAGDNRLPHYCQSLHLASLYLRSVTQQNVQKGRHHRRASLCTVSLLPLHDLPPQQLCIKLLIKRNDTYAGHHSLRK